MMNSSEEVGCVCTYIPFSHSILNFLELSFQLFHVPLSHYVVIYNIDYIVSKQSLGLRSLHTSVGQTDESCSPQKRVMRLQ